MPGRESHGRVVRALDDERRRAAELARQATSLKDLIASMEQGNRRRAGVARKRPARPTWNASKNCRIARDLRKSPFADGREPVLPLPLRMRVDCCRCLFQDRWPRNFGEKDDFGGVERGISIGTQAGARPFPRLATAGCPSPVLPDIWTTFNRQCGQWLLYSARRNENVSTWKLDNSYRSANRRSHGRGAARTATAIAIGAKQPILYVEFRRTGLQSIGPLVGKAGTGKVRG